MKRISLITSNDAHILRELLSPPLGMQLRVGASAERLAVMPASVASTYKAVHHLLAGGDASVALDPAQMDGFLATLRLDDCEPLLVRMLSCRLEVLQRGGASPAAAPEAAPALSAVPASAAGDGVLSRCWRCVVFLSRRPLQT